MSLFSDPRWGEAWAHLPDYLGSHVRVSVTAIALGLAVSLPLAVVARDRPVMQRVLLAFASIVQTVPGLALLALFYPLLLAGASLTLKWFGFGFSAFGFLPAVLALALYSMLPVLRNTVTGLRGIDTELVQAARALGLGPRQTLWLIELPLARPTILQGLNQAIMMALAMVVVASMIGAKGLGEIVLLGLQRADPGLGFVGGLAIVLLAILLDRMAQAVLVERRPPA